MLRRILPLAALFLAMIILSGCVIIKEQKIKPEHRKDKVIIIEKDDKDHKRKDRDRDNH